MYIPLGFTFIKTIFVPLFYLRNKRLRFPCSHFIIKNLSRITTTHFFNPLKLFPTGMVSILNLMVSF